MSAEVDLESLTRRELENLMLTEHGALTRILEAVRMYSEPGWKVRREVERIVKEAADRRPFAVAFQRSADATLSELRSDSNERRWRQWR
ncbi:MAG TPA: hypothetical protein VGU43_04515 [Thermoplasmata archaeon]|nr:hypothetical protein [Thermoplasmata archaeon]